MITNYWKQKKNCQGKKSYDKKGAITVRNFLWDKEHIELREYPCPICHLWHITSRC